jgi:hypothetical protein
MNEDANGITPADVTAITIEHQTVPGETYVVIERGNGDLIQDFHLTPMERMTLAGALELAAEHPGTTHYDFVDVTR